MVKKTFYKLRIIHCIFILLSFLATSCQSETEDNINKLILDQPYKFDVSSFEFAAPRDIPGMVGSNPDGVEIKVNSSYLTKGGIPWIPSYGEFQYSRYPAEHWEDAILKMKSQGFYAISTYVFWIHHEEIEGKWNFEGRMNLRHFLELCKKHDMGVFMRIGPWVNGECRNGGHPDWLVKRLGDPKDPFGHSGGGGRLRSTDPGYLAAVDKLYFQLSKQMEALYWTDGGPVFAIQLDNELTPYHAGPNATDLHEAEKEMALKYGMKVPIYTTTAWNGAEYIQDHTIPVHGSYGDYFWGTAKDYYRTPAYSFSTMRAVDDVDTEANPMDENEIYDIDEYNNNPYMTCETGIGINIAYHRRPNITAKDNGAISLVELGSGCNGMGYFMNLGGNNPVGELTYLNRSIADGPCDNPVISNDFQGAIGEFGQIRESFYEYPVQLNFMADFGKYLAPCRTFVPTAIDELQGNDLLNSLELQRALRTDGHSAFLFVNNHVKHDTAYQFNNVQFDVQLKDEKISIPENPVNIPIGSYFYWPINLTLSGVTIRHATAQPVLHLEGSNTYMFFQNEGIRAEFIFTNDVIKDIKTTGAKVEKHNEISKVVVENAGLNCLINVELKDGTNTKFIVLTEKQAKQHYKDGNTLYLTDAEVILFDQGNVQLISEKTENSVWMYPANTIAGAQPERDGLFEKVSVNFKETSVDFEYNLAQDGKNISYKNPKYKHNDNIGVPNDSIFSKGTIVEFSFPNGIPDELYDVRVNVDYKASALRFYKNREFVYDNYYNETIWTLGTRHLLTDYAPDMKLELKFIPFQPYDMIYFNGKYWPDLKKTENVLEVNNITPVPVYEAFYSLK